MKNFEKVLFLALLVACGSLSAKKDDSVAEVKEMSVPVNTSGDFIFDRQSILKALDSLGAQVIKEGQKYVDDITLNDNEKSAGYIDKNFDNVKFSAAVNKAFDEYKKRVMDYVSSVKHGAGDLVTDAQVHFNGLTTDLEKVVPQISQAIINKQSVDDVIKNMGKAFEAEVQDMKKASADPMGMIKNKMSKSVQPVVADHEEHAIMTNTQDIKNTADEELKRADIADADAKKLEDLLAQVQEGTAK